MFRSKRSGLLRRLWRSRSITDRDGGDGSKRSEGGRDSSCGSNPEKIPKTELRSVTRADPSLGTFGEVCNEHLTDSADQGHSLDHGRSAMCVPEHRGTRQGQEVDSRTVTCCLFRERDPRPRSPVSARRKDRGSLQATPRNDGQETNPVGLVSEHELKNVTYALLKRLKEKPLDALLEAVESKGGMPTECVSVQQTDLRLGGHTISSQFLLCKLYRWTDLQHTAQLKALFHCQSFGVSDSATVCCNPYHYSRLCGPESPPPPYSRLSPTDEHKPLDLSDSTLSYTEPVAPHSFPVMPRDFIDTGTSLGSSTSGSRCSHWCSVAYWEQRTRVGRLYPAHDPALSIFYDLPQGTGLCLGQLNGNAYQGDGGARGNDNGADRRGEGRRSNCSQGDCGGGGGDDGTGSCVRRTRSKIGYGIVLSREPDGVWVYNRSQHPVFVHSPTLEVPSGRGLAVRRVMPGFSLKVFDYERSSWILAHGAEPELQEGPYDPLSVRISFAKGWGPCYSRQFITSCPCWLEVLLNNHR